MLNGVALELIARNPKLKELVLSYVEFCHCLYRDNGPTPFAMCVLQVLQNHQHQSSSLSIINNESGLHSLKLDCRGINALEDICSIIENCPPSIQELTVHSYINHNDGRPFPDEQAMLTRFAAIKNDSIHNNHYSVTTTTTNSINRQRTPNLRLLNIDYYYFTNYRRLENEGRNSEISFFPIVSCFPDLKDLVLPKLSDNWISHNSPELISILTTSCLSLKNINFEDNFISEEHMYRFLLSLPKG